MESRLQRLEAVQKMFLSIGQISANASSVHDFLKEVHLALARAIPANNFHIVLFHAEDETLQFSYFVDEQTPTPDPDERFSIEMPNLSWTSWVILNHQALITKTEAEIDHFTPDLLDANNRRSEQWLGYPLLDQQKTAFGAMIVQSYDKKFLYSTEDQALLELVANQIGIYMQAFQSADRLEQTIKQRTALLAHEVNERRHSENVQHALFSIAELSFSTSSEVELYRALHMIIEKLMVAKNFLIAHYHQDCEEISIQYFVDEKDEFPVIPRFPLGMGMTSFVIHTGKPQLIDQKRLKQLIASGEIQNVIGSAEPKSWVGAPIVINDKVYGAIIVLSYDDSFLYGQADLDLLAFVASHVAVAIARLNAKNMSTQTKVSLEQENTALNTALVALQEAQSELVRKEKLASLGGLVAGVAHEINTPLGICVTATSHLIEELRISKKDFNEGKLETKKLVHFFDVLDQSLRILNTNTKRAATLVRSFKQVAVDQTSEDRRRFHLASYLDEILASLQPKLKGRQVQINIECADELSIDSYPGAFSQIITNFVMNSLNHGFENRPKGVIDIKLKLDGKILQLDYQDDGRGMDKDALTRLYEPFYTTKREQGGSGLGTHIIYNIVTGLLEGSIKATSPEGSGLHYQVRFPATAKI